MPLPTPCRLGPCALALLLPTVAAQDGDALGRAATWARERGERLLAARAARENGSRLALVALALCDAPESAERTRALQRLAKAKIGDTYGLALRLMVAAAAGSDLPDGYAVATADLKALLGHQGKHGAFGYRPGDAKWDLSNTQYAALGLHAATELGLEVPADRWRRLGRTIVDSQWVYGGFGYRRDEEPTFSMTIAGVTVLDLCYRHLPPRSRGRGLLLKSTRRGWDWLRREDEQVGAFGQRFLYYAHYGLARAALLSDRERVSADGTKRGVDWYRVGAAMLLELELPTGDGGWADRAEPFAPLGADGAPLPRPGVDAVATSFAVLFLRKALPGEFPKRPTTGPRGLLLADLPKEASVRQVEQCIALETARGLSAFPDVLRAMRSEARPHRRAAGLILLALAKDSFGYVPYRHPATQEAAIARAEAWFVAQRVRR